MAKNPNSNCLQGRSCQKCGSYGPFIVAVNTWVTLNDDGTDDPPKGYGDTEYDENTPARCNKCGYQGKWIDFNEGTNNRPFTVIGTCLNAGGEDQPFIGHAIAATPQLAAIQAIQERAKEVGVEECEPVAIEVMAGHHDGHLGNWAPQTIDELTNAIENPDPIHPADKTAVWGRDGLKE